MKKIKVLKHRGRITTDGRESSKREEALIKDESKSNLKTDKYLLDVVVRSSLMALAMKLMQIIYCFTISNLK